jgi:hypothetical protein
VSERHLGRQSAPALVVECAPVHSDHVVEAIGVSAFLRHEVDRRRLVRDETLSVDEELVPLRFAAEDRVVVEDEAAAALVFLEEDRGGESADSTADGDEIVDLASVCGIHDSPFESAIAHRVSGAQDFPGVAVRVCVVADPAVAVEGILRRDGRRFVVEEESGPG